MDHLKFPSTVAAIPLNEDFSTPYMGKLHSFQGTMVTAKYVINDYEYSSHIITPDEIKRILLQQLVNGIYKSKTVEFTKMADNSHNQHVFHARIFALPDAQVRVLRENNITRL